MHIDLSKETPEYSAKSLFEVAALLDVEIKELAAKTSAKHRSLIHLLGKLCTSDSI